MGRAETVPIFDALPAAMADERRPEATGCQPLQIDPRAIGAHFA